MVECGASNAAFPASKIFHFSKLYFCWARVARRFGALFVGEAGEREADAGSGASGGQAHGGEDVGGFGGAGLAGGASADGEALEVECDDEGFGFDVIEVEVGGIGD